jgi:CubicO group peptidase (beta-lactamase class C family)
MRAAVLIALAVVVSGFSRTDGVVSGFSRTDQPGPKGPALQGGLEDALAVAKDLPRLHSLLVSRPGELVLERYYNGARATRPANIKSASKSLISALVGIAIDRRLVSGVETPIATYFPELKHDRDPAKQRITIEDL